MIDSAQLRRVLALCESFLATSTESDWTTAVPELEWNVAEVVAHVSQVCVWYSIDLAAKGVDLPSVEIRVTHEHAPADLLATLAACGTMLAAAVDAADADQRGFHPWGMTDPAGFAAMACDELLIHTGDIAQALDREFQPSDDMVQPVLERLFPWVEPAESEDLWDLLRWANGRRPLGARARKQRWKWHCSPLSDWDGTEPTLD